MRACPPRPVSLALKTSCRLQLSDSQGDEEIAPLAQNQSPGGMDKMTQLTATIESTKQTMHENIAMVSVICELRCAHLTAAILQELDRANKVNDIDATASDMVDASNSFKRGASDLKNKEYWRMIKCRIIAFVIVLIAILVIVMYFCGIDFSDC